MSLLHIGVGSLGKCQKISQLKVAESEFSPRILSSSKLLTNTALLCSMNTSFPTLPSLLHIFKFHFDIKSDS